MPGKIGSIARNFRSISTRLETYHVLSLLFVSERGLFFSRRREEKEKEEAGEQPARGTGRTKNRGPLLNGPVGTGNAAFSGGNGWRER